MEWAFVEKFLESHCPGGMYVSFAKMNSFHNPGAVDKARRRELSSLLTSLILLETSFLEVEIRTNRRSKNASNKLVFSNNTVL